MPFSQYSIPTAGNYTSLTSLVPMKFGFADLPALSSFMTVQIHQFSGKIIGGIPTQVGL